MMRFCPQPLWRRTTLELPRTEAQHLIGRPGGRKPLPPQLFQVGHESKIFILGRSCYADDANYFLIWCESWWLTAESWSRLGQVGVWAGTRPSVLANGDMSSSTQSKCQIKMVSFQAVLWTLRCGAAARSLRRAPNGGARIFAYVKWMNFSVRS